MLDGNQCYGEINREIGRAPGGECGLKFKYTCLIEKVHLSKDLKKVKIFMIYGYSYSHLNPHRFMQSIKQSSFICEGCFRQEQTQV